MRLRGKHRATRAAVSGRCCCAAGQPSGGLCAPALVSWSTCSTNKPTNKPHFLVDVMSDVCRVESLFGDRGSHASQRKAELQCLVTGKWEGGCERSRKRRTAKDFGVLCEPWWFFLSQFSPWGTTVIAKMLNNNCLDTTAIQQQSSDDNSSFRQQLTLTCTHMPRINNTLNPKKKSVTHAARRAVCTDGAQPTHHIHTQTS